MFGLFGKKKKKKENAPRQDPAAKKAAAMKVLNTLREKLETDEARADHLQDEVKRVKKLLIAEKKKKKPDKRLITRHYRSWKNLEKQFDTYNNYIISTEKQIDSIQTQMGTMDSVAVMKQSAAFIKANQPNVEEVEDVTEALTEGMEDLEDVNNLIGEHANQGLDEDEMEGELEDLLEEEDEEDEIDVELPDAGLLPTAATELPDAPETSLPEVKQPAAVASQPQRVPIAVGAGGGATASAPVDDDEAELRAFFS